MKNRFLVIKTYADGSSFIAEPNVPMCYDDAKRIKALWETKKDCCKIYIYELHD